MRRSDLNAIFEGDEYRVAAVRAEPRLAQFWQGQERWPLPPRDENTPLPRLMRGERADSDEVARWFRDDVARRYEMMSPGWRAPCWQ
jgi:hypothetical protein